jgi:hypothetical protein
MVSLIRGWPLEKKYGAAEKILKEILEARLEDRNEKFLDGCVQLCKIRNGKFENWGPVGKSEEVYRHYLKMEIKNAGAEDREV